MHRKTRLLPHWGSWREATEGALGSLRPLRQGPLQRFAVPLPQWGRSFTLSSSLGDRHASP